MKAISKMLQSQLGPMLVRTWLILALCAANFLLAYGIAIYYNQGKSPAIMILFGIVTVVLVLILGVPNMEPAPEEEPGSPE